MQLKGLKNRYGYILADKKLGGGGEGDIYDITSHTGLVAKIYKPQYRTAERCKKIEAMTNDANANGFTLVSWPIDALYDENGFCGFVMKKFSNREDLGILLGDESIGWDKRVIIAYNLCDIVSEIHSSGQCIGDMNPQNFGIDISQTLSCCAFDADSFHYVDRAITGNNQVFKCSVGLGPYLAPEIHRQLTVHGQNLAALHPNNSFSQDTDLFALAELIFQLLFYGYHPFQAMRLPSYGSSTVVSKREKNIYNKMSPYFNPSYGVTVPKYSPKLNIIPQSMQELFRRAFIGGNENDRPRPDEWQRELLSIFNSRKQCSKDKQHVYWGGLSACPWCKISDSSPIPSPNPYPNPTPKPNPDPSPTPRPKHTKNKVSFGSIVFPLAIMAIIVIIIVSAVSGNTSPTPTPRTTPKPAYSGGINVSAVSGNTSPTPTPRTTPKPAYSGGSNSSGNTTAGSSYVSKKYNDVWELYESLKSLSNVDNNVIEDWLSYPSMSDSLYVIEKEVTIKVGDRVKLEVTRRGIGNENSFVHYSYWGNCEYEWSGYNGRGGHSNYLYITAEEPGVNFLDFYYDKEGVHAHMVVYAVY